MSEPEIEIRRGLPTDLVPDAAALFAEAFGEKLRPALPSAQRQRDALASLLRPDHIFAALETGELVGMVGLNTSSGPFHGGAIRTTEAFGRLRSVAGFVGAVRAVIGLSVGRHRPHDGEVYVDGIAVVPEVRGRGIGTRLLAEVEMVAAENGFRWVRLDVVDTNPRAQELYRRLGYEITNVQTFGYLRRFVGYGGMTSMELAVGRSPADEPGDTGTAGAD